MYGFLQNFASVVQGSNLDLVIFLNGSLEPEKLHSEWKKNQEDTFKLLDEINRHVTLKRKPPPKIWWVPPAYLRSAVRLAFRTLNVKVVWILVSVLFIINIYIIPWLIFENMIPFFF